MMRGRSSNWIREERGATAVEFALVAVPFIFLLVGIIEMSIMFAASANLHSASNDAARLIRTGQAQAGGDPETIFRDKLCERVDALLSCARLQYEVIKLDDFDDFANYEAVYDADGNLESRGFDAGGSSDIVMIRVSYRYPLMVPVIGNMLADGPGTTKQLLATVVMQSEPYDIYAEVDNL